MLLLFLVARSASAQGGMNLSWDDCGTAGASLKTFACDTNLGNNVLTVSFAPTAEVCLFGCNAELDIQSSEAALPDWWQFKNPGSCRQDELTSSAVFPPGSVSCHDTWQGMGISGVSAYIVGAGGPNRARIKVSVAIPVECQIVAAGVEAAAFRLSVGSAQTVGVGACPGCTASACIVLNMVLLDDYYGDLVLTQPLDRNFVSWQAGIPDCPGSTPVQNRTWGALKTMYR